MDKEEIEFYIKKILKGYNCQMKPETMIQKITHMMNTGVTLMNDRYELIYLSSSLSDSFPRDKELKLLQ